MRVDPTPPTDVVTAQQTWLAHEIDGPPAAEPPPTRREALRFSPGVWDTVNRLRPRLLEWMHAVLHLRAATEMEHLMQTAMAARAVAEKEQRGRVHQRVMIVLGALFAGGIGVLFGAIHAVLAAPGWALPLFSATMTYGVFLWMALLAYALGHWQRENLNASATPMLFMKLDQSSIDRELCTPAGLLTAMAREVTTRARDVTTRAREVSHSWRDDGREKYAALAEWADAFRQTHRRWPLLWLDKACIKQDNVQASLDVLPIHLAGCTRLLVLLGPSYLRRMWCVVECFTFLMTGGDAQRLLVLPVEDAGNMLMPNSLCRAATVWLRGFDVTKARCSGGDAELQMLRGVIERSSGSLESFSRLVTDCFTERLHNATKISLRQEERAFCRLHVPLIRRADHLAREALVAAGMAADGSKTHNFGTMLQDIATYLQSTEEDDGASRKSVKATIQAHLPSARDKHSRVWHKLLTLPLVDPRTSRWLPYWDLVTTIALLITATFTPFEVAFLAVVPQPRSYAGAEWGDPIYLTNRALDLVFFLDMLLNFNLIFSKGTFRIVWVETRLAIAVHYLTTWFILDFFSCLVGALDIISESSEGSLDGLRMLKLLRALRLLKLARLFRTSRLITRWTMRISINFHTLDLMTCLGMIVALVHWAACIWGLQATFDVRESWLASDHAAYQYCTYAESGPDGLATLSCADASTLYFAALYWAVNVIATVGANVEGATPGNKAEQFIAVLITLCGALTWVVCSATLAASFTTLDPITKAFRINLDHCNDLCSMHALPSTMRLEMRQYLSSSAHVMRHEATKPILNQLTPTLRGEISWLCHRQWITSLWFLRLAERPFLVELSGRLVPAVFSVGERLPSGKTLYIVQHGIAVRSGRVLNSGKVWGDDIILSDEKLRDHRPARTISNALEVLTLDRPQLFTALSQYPKTAEHVRKCTVWFALRRAFLEEARKRQREREVEAMTLSAMRGEMTSSQLRQFLKRREPSRARDQVKATYRLPVSIEGLPARSVKRPYMPQEGDTMVERLEGTDEQSMTVPTPTVPKPEEQLLNSFEARLQAHTSSTEARFDTLSDRFDALSEQLRNVLQAVQGPPSSGAADSTIIRDI